MWKEIELGNTQVTQDQVLVMMASHDTHEILDDVLKDHRGKGNSSFEDIREIRYWTLEDERVLFRMIRRWTHEAMRLDDSPRTAMFTILLKTQFLSNIIYIYIISIFRYIYVFKNFKYS